MLPLSSQRGSSERAIVHVVEPQQLFVSALSDVFTEAGLSIDYISAGIDARRVLDDRPDLIFLDTDFLPEPLEAMRLVRMLAPVAIIAAYASGTSVTLKTSYVAAGADVVIEKSAERRTIVQGLREMEHLRKRRIR